MEDEQYKCGWDVLDGIPEGSSLTSGAIVIVPPPRFLPALGPDCQLPLSLFQGGGREGTDAWAAESTSRDYAIPSLTCSDPWPRHPKSRTSEQERRAQQGHVGEGGGGRGETEHTQRRPRERSLVHDVV